jgi:hypothetical protein
MKNAAKINEHIEIIIQEQIFLKSEARYYGIEKCCCRQ